LRKARDESKMKRMIRKKSRSKIKIKIKRYNRDG